MRKIYETREIDSHVCRVYRDAEAQEYVVRFYIRNFGRLVHMDASDYFTDDKTDAINTAEYSVYGPAGNC